MLTVKAAGLAFILQAVHVASIRRNYAEDGANYEMWYSGISAGVNLMTDLLAATKAFEHVVHINPNNTKAWKNLGMVFDDIGRHEEAAKAYQQAIRTNPNPT